jgi:hypothetical protein
MAALTCGLSVWVRRTESRSQGACQFLEGGQLVDARPGKIGHGCAVASRGQARSRSVETAQRCLAVAGSSAHFLTPCGCCARSASFGTV